MSSQLDISITPPSSQASGITKGREDRKIEKARCSGCLQQTATFHVHTAAHMSSQCERLAQEQARQNTRMEGGGGTKKSEPLLRGSQKGKTAAVQSSWLSSEFKGYTAAHALGDTLCHVHTKANFVCLVGLKSRPNCIGKKKEWGRKGRNYRWGNGGLIEVCYVYVWCFWTIERREKKEMPSFKINGKAKCGGWHTPLKPSNWETKAGNLCVLEVSLIYLASSMPARVT